MATYKGIKGFKVQSLASDPTVEDTVGKVWYNTTSKVLKYSAEGDGAWASGGALNTGRWHAAGTGTQTASLLAGGLAAGSEVTLSETYNGSTWSEGNDINTARRVYHAGAGTTTAALIAGGYLFTAVTETYDGTSWTEVNDLNSARYTSGCGTQTAALAVTGQIPPGLTVIVEEYNGTSWTEKADVNTAVRRNPATGTTTAALKFAGTPPGTTALTEQFDGTSWTEVADLNNGRTDPAGAGTSTLALCYGGAPYDSKTEAWNGTSWTEVANMATARQGLGGGTNLQSAALGMGGAAAPGVGLTDTEEWNDPVYSAKTVTTS